MPQRSRPHLSRCDARGARERHGYGDQQVEYRTDAELAAAIAALEEKIAARVKTVVVRTLPMKGW
jgi:hypothetical protein